ncbi:MAG: flagellar protein [Alphaproteobacteria bacterium]|nr:flagellar protein [Alphaproteobacteria bacterium]
MSEDEDGLKEPLVPEIGGKRPEKTDRMLLATGLLIAGFAAFFPWYVFLNQEQFGVRPMGFASNRDLPELPARSVVAASPLAIPDSDTDSTGETLDTISTATVNIDGERRQPETDADAGPEQQFPGQKSSFRLLHVVNGRALIEDGSGMYVVRIGSILPDNSRLATLEMRNGSWVIVTSDGDVIER